MARNFDDIKDENRGLFSKRTEELYRQRQDRIDQQSVAQYRIAEQIAQNQKKVQEVLDRKYRDKDKQMEELTQLGLQYKALENLSEQIDSTSRYAAQKQFASSMRTSLGSKAVTHGIASIERSSQNLGASLSMARGVSTFQLEEQEREARAAAERMRPKIMEAVENVDEPGGKARLDYLSSQQDKYVRKAGLAGAAISAQKKLGIDISSRYFDAGKTMSGIQRDQQAEQIREDVAAGRVGSREDVEQKLKLSADRLAAVFDKLTTAVNETDDEAKNLGEEFAKLEDQYKKHQQTLKEMDRQGVGGGGLAERLRQVGGIIHDLGTVTQAAAQGYRVVNITSEMQQTQNRIGYAQLANQRFEDVYEATQGDMAALRRILSNQYEEQARRGAEYRDREQLAVGGETLGIAGKLVGSAFDAATSRDAIKQAATGGLRGGKLGAAIGYGAEIAAKAAPNALDFTRSLTDYSKDISAGRTDISTQIDLKKLQDTISKISDRSSQMTFDYYRDLTLATRGLGLGTNFGSTSATTAYEGTGMLGRNANAAARMLDTGAASDYKPEPEPESKADQAFTMSVEQLKRGEAHGTFSFSGIWKGLKNLFSDDSSKPAIADSKFPEIDSDLVSPTSGSRSVSATPSPFGREVLTRGTTQQSVVSSTGAVSGGGDRELVVSTLMNKDIINKLSLEAGLGLKDIPRVIGGFRTAIGKELTGGLEGQAGINTLMENVTKSGQFARAGYFDSPDQYIQARGALTGVGGTGEDLEKIMKQAVAAGMDSSKNIMEMVGAVQQLNQTQAGAGIDTVAATTEMLGRSIQELRGMGVQENMANKVAALGMDAADKFATSGELDVYNAMEYAGLRQDFPGAEWWELDALATASPKELEQIMRLQKKGEAGGPGAAKAKKQAERLAEGIGLGLQLKSSKDTEKALRRTREQVAGSQTGMLSNPKLYREYLAELEDRKLLSEMSNPKVRNYVNARTRVTAGRDKSGAAVTSSIQFERDAEERKLEKTPQGKMVSGAEDAMQSGPMANAKMFADGMTNFKEAIGGIQNVGNLLKDIADRGLNVEKFKDDVADAAKEMKAPLNQFADNMTIFNTRIGALNTSVQNFSTEMNSMIEKMKAAIQNNNLDPKGINLKKR